MAAATFKTKHGAVIHELVRRANERLGYPKVGISANGAQRIGAGIHVPAEQVVTDCETELTVDPDGTTFLHITDEYRAIIESIKAEAQARIDAMNPVALDAEILALNEGPPEFGSSSKPVPKRDAVNK